MDTTVTRPGSAATGRVRATVDLLEQRGYAVSPERLAELCVGGAIEPGEVLRALGEANLQLSAGLVVSRAGSARAPAIQARAVQHQELAAGCLPETLRFVDRLGRLPFVLAVSIAGSLASGGYAAADDVDLNLVVADGCRHQAYVAINALGFVHALRHRSRPVDDLTRRPLAPRFMTANLIVEASDCFPFQRQDSSMAFEILQSQPVLGAGLLRRIVAANPGLRGHFPQLADKPAPLARERGPSLPVWLFPAGLEAPARALGRAAWRYMQWTRRKRPAALARVAFVRDCMRPYTLFPNL